MTYQPRRIRRRLGKPPGVHQPVIVVQSPITPEQAEQFKADFLAKSGQKPIVLAGPPMTYHAPQVWRRK